MSAQPTRVMIVGWDSAPPALVFDHYAARMPNLTALRQQGCWGPMRSSDPPITVPAWTSMLTSRNPGQLGFFGFRNRKRGTYEGAWIATNAAVREPRVWDLLPPGKTACVHGVPQTYPVRPLPGLLIADFLTPSTDSEYTYPASLKAEINLVAGGYQIDTEGFRTDDKAALLAQIHTVTEKHHRVNLDLLERQRWDFFMAVEMGPDRLQHAFWKYCDPTHAKFEPGNPFQSALEDYYARLDEMLGELLAYADDDTVVFVVSDHGAKAMKGQLNINEFLMREGWMYLRQPVPPGTQLSPDLIDWSRTRAWGYGGYYSRICMNVAGREPQGVIPPADYERVRDELAELICAIPDDQGRPMATAAHRPQDLFTGPYVPDAPDLFVYFDDLYWRGGQDLNNPSLYSFDTELGPDDAVHDYQGIFVMAGAGVPPAGELAGIQLMDVAPTVLRYLGLPIPETMEGTVVA